MSIINMNGSLIDPNPKNGTKLIIRSASEDEMREAGTLRKAYKLMRLGKDGKVYPLFIDKKTPTEFGKWLPAECHPTKGFAVRKGWHCCFTPYAPHLKENLASGEQRVWVEVEVADFTTYDRPESQGGAWILANEMKALRTITMEEAEQIRKEAV